MDIAKRQGVDMRVEVVNMKLDKVVDPNDVPSMTVATACKQHVPER